MLDEKRAGYVAKHRLNLNDVSLDELILGVRDQHFFETTVSIGGSEEKENLKVAWLRCASTMTPRSARSRFS